MLILPSARLALFLGSGLELDYQLGRYPSAVFHLDALCLGPLTDLGAVQPPSRCPTPAPGRPSGASSCPPGSSHITRQRGPQRLGMFRAQVDLVLRTVQPEPDSTFSLTAIKVIDEQGLYLLSHGCSVLLPILVHQRRQATPHMRSTHRCTFRPGRTV